jgi:hypothetical protein
VNSLKNPETQAVNGIGARWIMLGNSGFFVATGDIKLV